MRSKLSTMTSSSEATKDDLTPAIVTQTNPMTTVLHPFSVEEEEEAISRDQPRNANTRKLNGLYMQYAAVGLVSSALPGTLYGFLLSYLKVNSYVYATATQVILLPWSCKIIFGILNDRVPIMGYQRKAYIAIGWAFCTLSLVVLALQEMLKRRRKCIWVFYVVDDVSRVRLHCS